MSAAHFVHDCYTAFLAPALPLIIDKLGISYGMTGLLAVIQRIPSLVNPLIGIVAERGVIVANSSLKHPRPEYIDRVGRQTGIDLSGFLERGYTSVRPEYRGLGIGTQLLAGLTTRAQGKKIFSIIGEDNIATQKIALRNRTKKVAAFHSRALGKPVGVWMPESIADALAKE